MPVYEHECTKCGYRFEIQQEATARPLRRCPNVNGGKAKCGGELKKLFFPAAIIFKGSGWHVKDYGKHGAVNGNGGKRKDESKSEKKTETKGDKKEAAGAKG